MTRVDLKAEYDYRVAERIAILNDGGEPNAKQVMMAEAEAKQAVDELVKLENNLLL